MLGGGWLELRRDNEEGGGVVTLDTNAKRVLSQEFKRNFTIWFIGGCVIGPLLLFIPLCLMRQRMKHIVTPWQAGMWLGVMHGITCWGCVIVFLSLLHPSLPTPWRYVFPISVAIGAIFSYSIGVHIQQTYLNLVDPGANQIFGMRNVGLPFWLEFIKMSETPLQTVPVDGFGTSPPSAEEVRKHVMKNTNRPLKVAFLLYLLNLILMIALRPLGFLVHVALIFVIIIVFDSICCYNGRRYLKEVNQHPLMVRRNIKWVLRGYNFPFKIFSLWLVRANPNNILIEGFAGWYHYCTEEFKEVAKLFLWITSSSLPRDVALLALEYGSTHLHNHVTKSTSLTTSTSKWLLEGHQSL